MKSIFDDLFLSVYRYLGFGIVFGVVTMLALPEIRRRGMSSALRLFWNGIKNDSSYRWKFIFFIYLFMVLSRTLICRNIWQCPWENVIGEWGIYTSEGKFNTEGLLNIVLFCPLTFFGLLGFRSYIKRKYDKAKRIVLFILKYSLVFSSTIEVCQLFLRLGSFQFFFAGQPPFAASRPGRARTRHTYGVICCAARDGLCVPASNLTRAGRFFVQGSRIRRATVL